jgi:tetratricopeptide (TPR) repeat protein
VFLTAIWINNLAEDALQAENTSEARAKLAESLELARLIGDTRGIDTATLNLGWVELLEGDFDRARACFEEAAAIARRLGRRAYGAEAISGFSHLAAAVGHADRAARLARHVKDARAVLGERVWQKAWADGAELGFDSAFSLALDS